MYWITDDYGTSKIAWRYSTALEWLAACSPTAIIFNRFTGRFVAGRIQG